MRPPSRISRAGRAPERARLGRDALARWRELASDAGARFDASVDIDASGLEPMITYGTNPGMVRADQRVDPRADRGRCRLRQALGYMGFEGGEAMLGKRIDVVFIGSCTNGRLEDLQAAARDPQGPQGRRRRAPADRARARSRSSATPRRRGLADIFTHAGADWRESGCSMCLGMNGDTVAAGQYARQHQQPQFRGPPRRRRAHLAGQPAHRRRERRRGQDHRSRGSCCDGTASKRCALARPSSCRRSNIDTDQIIPARFLTTTTKEGLGKQLFADWRYLADGAPNPDFVLNQRGGRGHAGCWWPAATSAAAPRASTRPGRSSIYGFRAVISTEIADIFRSNALKNGLLPITVDRGHARRWLLDHPGRRGRHRSGDRSTDAADRRRGRLPDRGVRAPLPAERDRRARLSASQARRHRALRSRANRPTDEGMQALIAVLAGDGIGAEVTAEAVRALERVAERFGHAFRFEPALFGGAAIDATGDGAARRHA